MKHGHFSIYIIILITILLLVNSCSDKRNTNNQNERPQVVYERPQIVCPKGLPISECNNSSALHGQIMMHNRTDKSYDITVYTHNDDYGTEHHQLMPGKGWTFTGILQGQRMIIAKPSSGGDSFESYCMIVGGMQHIMNITHYGITKVEKKSHM